MGRVSTAYGAIQQLPAPKAPYGFLLPSFLFSKRKEGLFCRKEKEVDSCLRRNDRRGKNDREKSRNGKKKQEGQEKLQKQHIKQ
jgi:hypothetical protein